MLVLTGCPGTLANPNSFPSGAGGGGPAGAGPAGAGGPAGSGAAGTSGTAGTGAVADCDAPGMVFDTYFCSTDGSCHGSMPAAGFDMKTAGWETHLKGVMSKGGGSGATAGMCTTATQPYLVPGSNPATGLFIDKLTKAVPPCGGVMPSIGGPLTAAEKDCVIKWATKLAQ